MGTMTKQRSYRGHPLWSYGFRPFFLLGALYAGLAILAWVPMFQGQLSLASAFDPLSWHIHEMLYGVLPAIITGFLFTAIPNWTGRLPIQGKPLQALVAVWVSGRIAVTLSAWTGWWLAALIDASFLALVAAMAAREILASKNRSNLKIIVLITLLLAGNIAFHLEAALSADVSYASRGGIAVIIALIMVIGGRIIPSFTINWLKQHNPGRLPTPFARFDVVVIAVSAIALASWVLMPFGDVTAALLAVAGLTNIARLARWAGERTLRNRLLLVLHIGFAFIPAGFLLMAAASLGRISEAAAIHAWTAGAAGVMTLAVMTRASLGHSGRALAASSATQAIYALIVIAALTRICAGLHPQWNVQLLYLAAIAWSAAYLGFVAAFGPMLMRAKGK